MVQVARETEQNGWDFGTGDATTATKGQTRAVIEVQTRGTREIGHRHTHTSRLGIKVADESRDRRSVHAIRLQAHTHTHAPHVILK